MADSKDKTGVVAFPGIKRAGKPDIAFGKALREYRLRAHMEQEQFAGRGSFSFGGMGAIRGGAVESIVNQLVIQKMRYSLLMTKSSQG